MGSRAAAISPPASGEPGQTLRRDISVWGSFMWGYADVGADIYAALGIVVAASMGLAPLAFAVAGGVYVLIGLAYTELASSYPVAGGGQYYTARGLGDFWGFVAGSALLLDYTIDIALFAAASAGYVNFFIPAFREYRSRSAACTDSIPCGPPRPSRSSSSLSG
jgi:APA family basic amino acid/polyamine antiporter